jgi:hypothetical protein
MAKNPLPLVPFAIWQRMFAKFGAWSFERQAARYGVSKEQIFDRPYAGAA